MTTITRLLVNKRQIAQTRVDSIDSAPLAQGQVRLQIERLGLTANNISYAATGEMLQYWAFFPVDADWGCVPAWGFATVAESRCEGVLPGERFWGCWPMASGLVVEPTRISPFGFADGVAHRRKLAAVYNDYIRCAVDPLHQDGQDDAEALLRPMFTTAWLVDDFMADNQFFGASTLVLSSASSKTAYGTAFQLFRRGGVQVVGLTARRNLAFVESLGCYHRVLAYEDVAALDALEPSVYLDYAGSADIRRAVHQQLTALRYSCSIGASHVDKVGSATGLPGPKPIFLFVPTQAAKRVGEWGMPELMQRMARDWRRFVIRALAPADPWLVVTPHTGPQAVQDAYALVLRGQSDARSGHMLSL